MQSYISVENCECSDFSFIFVCKWYCMSLYSWPELRMCLKYNPPTSEMSTFGFASCVLSIILNNVRVSYKPKLFRRSPMSDHALCKAIMKQRLHCSIRLPVSKAATTSLLLFPYKMPSKIQPWSGKLEVVTNVVIFNLVINLLTHYFTDLC